MSWFIIRALTLYRRFLSPLKPPCCRFYPTCSMYGILAVKKHGAFWGSIKLIKRLLRCNPFFPGGYDPV